MKRGSTARTRGTWETLVRVCLGGPVGVETIAATMNTMADTLSDDVEPFLLRYELILRTRAVGLPRPRRMIIWESHRPAKVPCLIERHGSNSTGFRSIFLWAERIVYIEAIKKR